MKYGVKTCTLNKNAKNNKILEEDIVWIKKNMQLYLLYKFRRKLTFEICTYEQISDPVRDV